MLSIVNIVINITNITKSSITRESVTICILLTLEVDGHIKIVPKKQE